MHSERTLPCTLPDLHALECTAVHWLQCIFTLQSASFLAKVHAKCIFKSANALYFFPSFTLSCDI